MTALTLPRLENGKTVCRTKKLAPEDNQLLRTLARLWRSHDKRDLGVRWKTGKLLNARLGNPTKRLTHGGKILKKAAKLLQMAESDLSRMRWFAFLFESIQDFDQKHPKVYSWTKVKELIPEISAAVKGEGAGSSDEEKSSPGYTTADVLDGDGAGSLTEEKSSSEGKDAAVIGSILRSLGTATERFRQNGFVLNDPTRERMRTTIRQLLDVVSDRLGVRFTIEVLSND
jgi:hypothetical protein